MPRKEACPTKHTQTHTYNQLEWKLMPPVKAGDIIFKQRVCFEIRRGPRLYSRQRGNRRQQESEREQKYTHTLLTPSVKEIQEAFGARFVETLIIKWISTKNDSEKTRFLNYFSTLLKFQQAKRVTYLLIRGYMIKKKKRPPMSYSSFVSWLLLDKATVYVFVHLPLSTVLKYLGSFCFLCSWFCTLLKKKPLGAFHCEGAASDYMHFCCSGLLYL